MSECVISKKYLYIYLYIYICLFHFVANEEKLLLRYDDGKQKKEWEFKLELETEGGQELYNRLQKNKKIELKLELTEFILIWSKECDENFISLLKNRPPIAKFYGTGDLVASLDALYIVVSSHSYGYEEKIGKLIQTEGFDYEQDLLPLAKRENNQNYIKLELVYESDEIEKSDTTNIPEINKKIIIIAIIGLSLSILIILFIIKFIV